MKGRCRGTSAKGIPFALLLLWLSVIPGRVDAQASPDLGWLGISIADVGEELADRLTQTFGPAAGTGVLVVDVLKGGPAEHAPLKRGDVIVRVDAQPIWDVRQLQRTIRSQPINQRVLLTVLRESSCLTLPVTIGAMPVEARAQLAGERFGFLVRAEDERDPRRGQEAAPGRIFVAFVDTDSPAARAGLRPQDVILQANGQPTKSLEDFDRAMRRADRAVSLLVERRDTPAPLALTLELPHR
ncbi:MAG: PDZ domain-containing protein [candidate division NC10 bacterium]|nr:PDZ domain-containing protein [candidate division NC10 bacterium]